MSSKPCKICGKFCIEFDDRGVCQKCLADVPRPIRFIRDGINLIPNHGDSIVSRDEWNRIKREIDKFYQYTRDDEIEKRNFKLRESNSAYKYSVKLDWVIAGYVYLLESSNGCYKIGKTRKIEKRLYQLLREYPLEIKVLHYIPCRDHTKAENYLHKFFEDYRLQGDWFRLDKEQIDWLKNLSSDALDELVSTGI
jgi:hypothetical protein